MSKVAAVQMASGPQTVANLSEAARWIGVAAEQGAELVVLPENFALMEQTDEQTVAIAEQPGDGAVQSWLRQQAIEHRIWIVGGTLPLQVPGDERVTASCLVFNAEGEQVARYNKMHLFDVELPEQQESYTESRCYQPGEEVVVIDSPLGRLGLAVCYDLRFPELFREMASAGAEIVAVPAAFTATTGRAHWELLVRARAVENLSFVVAAAQGGFHVSGRETYGHSMIVDPWGSVLAEQSKGAGLGAGVIVSEIDLQRQQSVRRSFPVLSHRRLMR